MYHEGNRALQDAFGSRALADRLDEKLRRERFNDDDAAFIGALGFFFLATADARGPAGLLVQGRRRRGSRGSPRRTCWSSPTTTATACSRAWATSASIRTWACCSSPLARRPSGCG